MPGKSKKKFGSGDAYSRPGPLSSQILKDQEARPSNRSKTKRRQNDQDEEEGNLVDSRKILKQARRQQEELLDEFGESSFSKPDASTSEKPRRISLRKNSSDDVAAAENSDDDEIDAFSSPDVDGFDPQIDEDDERALNQFMSTKPSVQRTLNDIILQKIEDKRHELTSELSDDDGDGQAFLRKLDPRLIEMYKGVGRVLSTYRSGKLPKAFKIIPKLSNWEQILFLTEPEKWTAASMYQATRIFVSNLNAKMCQRFLNLVLLPRIRDDIMEYKKLNFHLYQALVKGLFKPAAFFKGVLLPLCESGTCTLREAVIVGSVLTKCSIPMLHTAAAILKIAEMDYSGANSLFLRLLIDKKYTLPFRVVDGLVNHFLRFANDTRRMTVLWHQALLALVQRYKSDLSSEQKDALMDLIKTHFHADISPEIRRELTHAEPRDVEEGGNEFSPDMDT